MDIDNPFSLTERDREELQRPMDQQEFENLNQQDRTRR